ncbi:MAG: Levansucrase [Candidatus Erwinia impunctatus]|nr:Levansucrase [Culicoides impunctatus]
MNIINYKSTAWTRADALKVQQDDPTTTQPLISTDFPVMSEEVFVWDTMPLRNMSGDIVSVNGWSVIFTLTAERNTNNQLYRDANGRYDIRADWEDRHGRARICYWYSRTGKNWIFGGRVMAEGVSPTSREWAGTPILLNNEGDIDLYYTCVTPGATIAKVRGKIITSEAGVVLSGFDLVKSLFSADGHIYQTEEQNPYWNFRDHCPFIDKKSGRLFMLFEGNVAGMRGTHVITKEDRGLLPPGYDQFGGARYQVGCTGLAVAEDLSGDKWTLLPPLITAVGVNDQTERPHLVVKDENYYLFTISHKYTYADNLTGPDGEYGFVSKNLTGPYVPMNGSGLVLGNPSSQPFQTYSHYVMPNGMVTSFIDSIPVDGETYRIGGTEAPTVKIALQGERSFVTDIYDYGYIPPMKNVVV